MIDVSNLSLEEIRELESKIWDRKCRLRNRVIKEGTLKEDLYYVNYLTYSHPLSNIETLNTCRDYYNNRPIEAKKGKKVYLLEECKSKGLWFFTDGDPFGCEDRFVENIVDVDYLLPEKE